MDGLMKSSLGVRLIVLLTVIANTAPAHATEPSVLVARAIEKIGGAEKLSGITSLSTAASHRHWDPQETLEPDIGNRLGGESRFTLSEDFAKDRARYDWVRLRVAPMTRTFIYSEVFAEG